MRPLGFKTRLWLGHVAVLAAMLALAAFGADWALRRVVLGRIIDDAVSQGAHLIPILRVEGFIAFIDTHS